MEHLRHMARLVPLCCSAHRTFCPIPLRGALAQGEHYRGPMPLFPTRAPMCYGASSRTRRSLSVETATTTQAERAARTIQADGHPNSPAETALGVNNGRRSEFFFFFI